MRFRAFAVLALVGALAAPLSAQSTQTTPSTPTTRVAVRKLADGVWAGQPEKGATVGWFLLGDGVVAVDSGGDAESGEEILQAIAQSTGNKPVRTLILTHAHADHAGGARAFAAAGARVICQEGVAGQVLAFVTQAPPGSPDPLAGKPDLRPVVESIAERQFLLDGVHTAQIYFLGSAHTKGDLIVYLPTDKVLFVGDLASGGHMVYMQSADVDPAGWERALAELTQIPAQTVVPGHGDIGDKTLLTDSYAYVRDVNALVKKFLDAGMTDDMLDAQIRAPENDVKGIKVSEAHIANVKAAVKAAREKAAAKPTPTPRSARKK